MIRFALYDDIPQIMQFIDEYWRKGHIMSRSQVLFDFQHLWNVDGINEVSFVISEEEDVINGLLGFIPYDTENRDVTLAIWKTIKTKDTMLGLNILQFLRKNGRVHSINAPGINAKTRPIYKFLGYQTGEMKHWYRLNRLMKQTIGLIDDSQVPDVLADNIRVKNQILETYEDAYNFGLCDCLKRVHQLYKSPEFIKRRYFSHPSYEYISYGIQIEQKKLIMVFRIQPCKKSQVLRLIDCIGDQELIGNSAFLVDHLMRECRCEYIDCYEANVPDEYFYIAGWRNVADTKNVIPDYFSPYEQKNVDIYYMTENKGTILYKGDGDMDRPN